MYAFIEKEINFLDKNDKIYDSLYSIVTGYFMHLFVDQINLKSSYNIWDSFFIYGDIILFRAFYFYASFIFDKEIENFKLKFSP